MTALRVAAAAEAGSLAVLLVNLVTVHNGLVTSVGGPVHGLAYVAVIGFAFALPAPGARWRAFIPGVGGLLALRRHRIPSTHEG
ncbi:DUF3817 domain-containing protein [Saccharothrix syringae]|uniref:DUF3817 domain-containing protein n=1 Tax=Saccharothrix syringae TaxID=103733 RepID=A0A5Q0GWZ9_SACSY|nr:DUF3817 domain-containing protein [Saccharothrix syringae]QFZ17882.1 DUF3817 domain-containing protein [Saccharothrix syringae]